MSLHLKVMDYLERSRLSEQPQMDDLILGTNNLSRQGNIGLSTLPTAKCFVQRGQTLRSRLVANRGYQRAGHTASHGIFQFYPCCPTLERAGYSE
jgi:hypothetical protein